jgi:tRNA(fMet)-specific endonuclease VapC
MYLLDTNIISYISRGHPKVISKLSTMASHQVCTCSIVMSELFFGAMNHPDTERGKTHLQNYINLANKTQIYDFDIDASLVFARLKIILKKQGMVIDDLDLQIAAIALANNLTLVTNNIKHFDKIPNLKLDDWTK